MTDPIQALILDLLEWIDARPRDYSEVIEVWRTSCPRLPVWEDATDRRLVECGHEAGGVVSVRVTALGSEFLERHRPHRRRPASLAPTP